MRGKKALVDGQKRLWDNSLLRARAHATKWGEERELGRRREEERILSGIELVMSARPTHRRRRPMPAADALRKGKGWE